MELTTLTAPLTAHEIEWRVQQKTKDGKKLIVVPYITNRCVMQRFDEQFGWAGWNNELKEIDGGFLCTITVSLGNAGGSVSKTDGASRTGIEPVKGGISDAMKRCAVQFGLGRGLYDFPKVFLETDDNFIPKWAVNMLDALVAKINAGHSVNAVIVLKESQASNYPAPTK